jgi:hypothetical protein
MPSRPLLCGLLLLAVAPPFVARALGSGPFAFAMFTEVERYHLELRVLEPTGWQQLRLSELAPHLSRDAARVVLPAQGYGFGREQVQLLGQALPDLARLVCQLRPTSRRVALDLFHAPVNVEELHRGGRAPALGMPHQAFTADCHAR